jgi:hypothetical protein
MDSKIRTNKDDIVAMLLKAGQSSIRYLCEIEIFN